jgi:hypothetical protein
MPFKSKAQRRKFAELLVRGEITPEQFEEWNRETGRGVARTGQAEEECGEEEAEEDRQRGEAY